MSDYIDRVRKYGGFSADELKGIFISILAMGFIVGFNDNRTTFQFNLWFANLLLCFIIVAFSVFFKEMVKRLYGISHSFRVEYRYWFYGLITGIILTIISNGKLLFLATSGIVMHMLPTHRLGKYRYGLSYNILGMTSMFGPVANASLAVIAKTLVFLPQPLIQKIIIINIAMALSNMLPIPPLDGSNLFFALRPAYFFIFGSMIGIAFLLLHPAVSVLASVIGAIIIGFLILLVYAIFIDKRL